ncbi:MAG: response regulator [Eudoraea sp.]|uniref:response regulator n=1 Tax=Eudoraea sp. TaxID=1979955 RepID=UPI003C73B8C0
MIKLKSIAIVDDDPITVFGIKRMLSSLNVSENINTYVNGKEAIDDFKSIIKNNKEVPEVIFLDINMPIMDGWQFLEEFITLPIPHKIRINILTSSIDPADRESWQHYMTRTHHIIDYKNKPIQKKEIEEITKAA